MFGGYQDYLIFFELIVMSKLFSEISENNNLNLNIFLSIVCMSLILWTKQEGFFYFIILSMLFLFNLNYKKRLFLFSALLIILIGSYFLKKNLIGSFDFNEPILYDGLYRYLDPKILFSTFAIIIKNFIISLFKYPIWIIIFVLYFYLYKKNYKFPEFLRNYLILFFLLILAIYFQTSMDVNFLASVTMDRILLQGSGFVIFPVIKILFFNENLFDDEKNI